MMIWTWYKHFPEMAKFALSLFVLPSAPEKTPYGSWKDIKYFCEYIRTKNVSPEHDLIQTCVKMMNDQLRKDITLYNSPDDNATRLSLVAKWIPREKSRFGWLNSHLAFDYFPQYLATVNPTKPDSKIKAKRKCIAQYRMICATLNRHLDTVQIKQAGRNWSEIHHAKTTSITMAKQKEAFLNLKGKKKEVRFEDPDRIQCADNLKAYLALLKKEGKEVKGKNVGLEMFVAHACNLVKYHHNIGHYIERDEESDILNSQWRDNSNKKNANGLGSIIAMADLSGSMSGGPINAAIALSCRVAEKSFIGRRIMTFSAEPAWINLDGKNNFTDMVLEIYKKSETAGLNTDFYKALELILTVIEENHIPPSVVENMILAIFSDMQIDDNLSCMNGGKYGPDENQKIEARGKWATMLNQIKQKYYTLGMRMYGVPLNPPHILFWNLRKTNGFPTLSTEAGCSMMSGYDPTILNMFCELGMDALKELTPFNMLKKTLDNPRYDVMEIGST